MILKRKKQCSFFVIGIFFFLGGVEYAVILPTAWLYLSSRFHSQPYMLGILMSAFCISGLIAGPLMGRWSDKSGGTRNILLFANLWEIMGSILYFLGINQWCLILGRLIAGVGTGVGSALFADISRVTTLEERTSTMSMFMAVRQFGLIAGPGCNLFLRKLNFHLGPYIVDKYTAPGIFMAVLWLTLEILVICLYWDLPKLQLELQADALRDQMDYGVVEEQPPLVPTTSDITNIPTPSSSPSINSLIRYPAERSIVIGHRSAGSDLDALFTSSNEMIESAERYMTSSYSDSASPVRTIRYPALGEQLPDGTVRPMLRRHYVPDEVANSYGMNGNINGEANIFQGSTRSMPSCQSDSGDSTLGGTTRTWHHYYDEYMREEVVAILATVFVSMFDQLCLETIITPLTKELLNWGELENSYLYAAAGVMVLLVFLLIRLLSRFFDDRCLMLFGFMVDTVMNAYLLWFLPQAKPGARENLPLLIIGVFFNLFGLPFLVVSSISLYSKVTSEETQGFSQGLRRVFGGIGMMMGPLWAGALLSHLSIMLGVNLALMVISTMMLVLSFNKFKVTTAVTTTSKSDEDERTPLLS